MGTFDPHVGGPTALPQTDPPMDARDMGLLIAQLLFVERPDPGSVRLDVIVLDRAEAAMSPSVGAPIALGFGMPSHEDDRDRVLTVLGNWARRGAAVDISIHPRPDGDEFVLRSGVACITLHPSVPHGTAGGSWSGAAG